MGSWTTEEQRESNRKSYYKHKEKRLAKTKECQQRLKREVFCHYSDGEPKCACCGEKIIEFLALDHIGGGGAKSRAKNGSSYTYYFYLKKNGFPEGYRILCHNCNQATAWGRKCPHELMEASDAKD